MQQTNKPTNQHNQTKQTNFKKQIEKKTCWTNQQTS